LVTVSVADFSGRPAAGVVFKENSEKLNRYGLRQGMVVAALDGYRTDTLRQYTIARAVASEPKMNLIVWDGAKYRSLEIEVPGRKFGVNLGDYK
jgi:hypothetical protein